MGNELLPERLMKIIRAHRDRLDSLFGHDSTTGEFRMATGDMVPAAIFGNQRGSAPRTTKSRSKRNGRQHRRAARG